MTPKTMPNRAPGAMLSPRLKQHAGGAVRARGGGGGRGSSSEFSLKGELKGEVCQASVSG